LNDLIKYKDYQATIEYSSEDEIFHGRVIGMQDLISFEGKSVTELKKEFKESVDDYLVTCKKLKKSPEKNYKGSFNVRIPATLHREAALNAAIINISLNDFVRLAIVHAISSPKKFHKKKSLATV
jgi:predicted HicB family RNase H-like nuclease